MARYAPYYCEENVWWLAREPGMEHAEVVVITNRARAVAMCAQRAGEIVAWDYHVVLAIDGAVWDLDCTLGMPLPGAQWIDASFDPRVPPEMAPRFRVVAGALYRSSFASDRRHMRRADGEWYAPPPPWDPIGSGHDLDGWIDLDDTTLGPWIDATQMRAELL